MSRSTKLDFDILHELGSGAFGTVYKCRRQQDKEVYVIKEVRIGELTYKEQNEAINEVNILAGLDSEYVVAYFDSFIEKGSLHIVMEYCNRGDLQGLLRRAKEKDFTCLKENVTWNIGLQIISGLHYLHKQRVLHRDLKTANVFLQKYPGANYFNVKIGDLGVAKLLETSGAFANTIVGTPYYLSPELCTDQPYRDKSDCWALGVLLYECCTLTRPFEARNQCALIMKIVNSDIQPPPVDSVSVELRRVVTWLLQKDPEARPTIKQILCEKTIQDKLLEHHLPIPESLVEYAVTDRMGSTIQCTVRSPTGTGDSTPRSSEGLDRQWSPHDTAGSEEATFVRRNNGLYREENKSSADAKDDTDGLYDDDGSHEGSHLTRVKFSAQGQSRYEDDNGESRLRSSSRGLGNSRASPRAEDKEDSDFDWHHGQDGAKGGGGRDGTWSELQDGRARSVNGVTGAGQPRASKVPLNQRNTGVGATQVTAHKAAGVMGNRVRGGGINTRTTSTKAMNRHQVHRGGNGDAKASGSDRNGESLDEGDDCGDHGGHMGRAEREDEMQADSLEEGQVERALAREGGGGAKGSSPSSEDHEYDQEVFYDETLKTKHSVRSESVPGGEEKEPGGRVTTTVELDFMGRKPVEVGGGGAKGEEEEAYPGNHLGRYGGHESASRQRYDYPADYNGHDADYDDDFEDYHEEEEEEFYEGGRHELSPEYISHFGVPEGYTKRAGGGGEELEEDVTPSHSRSAKEEEDDGENEEQKVRELSARLTKELGEELFAKLYRLCMEQLQRELVCGPSKGGSNGPQEGGPLSDNQYLLEILKELQAHRKAEALVDVTQVVFSLKLLCAYAQTREQL